MKTGLIIIGVWTTVLLFCSLAIVGALGPVYSGSFYPFTLPFIFLAGISLVLSICGLVVRRIRAYIFWFAASSHGLLFLPFYYAIRHWPGGDDGPGLAWGFLIGGGSCIAAIIAIVFLLMTILALVRGSKESGQL